jgi:transcriptional activator HAC1
VSVELEASVPRTFPPADTGFPYYFQPHPIEKPLESLFDFEIFSEEDLEELTSVEYQTDPLNMAIFKHSVDSISPPDQLDVKIFDLQTASGAATSCDGFSQS